MEFFSDDNNSR